MGNLNKVFLMGNVGSIDVKQVGEAKVANVSLATTERGFTTKNGKEVPDKTEWHNLVLWRGLATLVESYVSKGDEIVVCGKLTYDKYEKDGVKHISAKIEVDDLQFTRGKKAATTVANDDVPDTVIIPEAEGGDDLPF